MIQTGLNVCPVTPSRAGKAYTQYTLGSEDSDLQISVKIVEARYSRDQFSALEGVLQPACDKIQALIDRDFLNSAQDAFSKASSGAHISRSSYSHNNMKAYVLEAKEMLGDDSVHCDVAKGFIPSHHQEALVEIFSALWQQVAQIARPAQTAPEGNPSAQPNG